MENQTKTETRPSENTQPTIPSAPPVSLVQETASRFGQAIRQEVPPPGEDSFYVARYKTKEEATKAIEEKDRLIGEHGQKLGKAELELQRLREENARLYQSMQTGSQKQEVAEVEPDYGDFYTDPVGVLKKHGDHLVDKFNKSLQKQQQEQHEQNIISADFTMKQTDLHPYEKFVRDRRDQLVQQGWGGVAAYQQAVSDIRSALQTLQQPAQQQVPVHYQYAPPQYQPQTPPQQPQYQQVPNLMPSQMSPALLAPEPPQSSPRTLQAQTGQYRMNLLKQRTDDQMGWYSPSPV